MLKDCNEPKNYKAYSEWAAKNHISQNCNENIKKYLNCNGDHRTLSAKCPLNKNNKKTNQERQALRSQTTYLYRQAKQGQ